MNTFHARTKVGILVPSFAEGENVAHILKGANELAAKLPHLEIGVLYVDDTPPGTKPPKATNSALKSLRSSMDLPNLVMVNLIHRIGREKWGGLGGAVVQGFEDLQKLGYDIALVMDGDGQHSFKTVRAMLERIVSTDGAVRYDLVNGSRKIAGGTNAGLDGMKRRFASWAGTSATKTTFPLALRDITDPMSGCFAVRLDRVDCSLLQRVDGFKILLELAATHIHSGLIRSVSEVNMTFLQRNDGDSKASGAHAKALLNQLMRLRRELWPNWVNFSCGALLAFLVGAVALELLVMSGLNQVTAYRCSLAASLYVNIRYNWKHTFLGGSRKRWKKPALWLTRIFVIVVSERISVSLILANYHHQFANMTGVLAGGMLNFAFTYVILSQGGYAEKLPRQNRGRHRQAKQAEATIPTQRSHARNRNRVA